MSVAISNRSSHEHNATRRPPRRWLLVQGDGDLLRTYTSTDGRFHRVDSLDDAQDHALEVELTDLRTGQRLTFDDRRDRDREMLDALESELRW